MRLGRFALPAVVAGLAGVALQNCNKADCCAPPPPDFLSLWVGVRVDSASFRSSGEFVLELVPADQTGHAFVTEPWVVSARITAPQSVPLMPDSQRVQQADTQRVGTAILIDDSGSMLHNDPGRERATAARLFWNEVLGNDVGNLVALLDFGRGAADTPSPGFKRTRLLQTFTSDKSMLDARLGDIQAAADGGSRLYRSAFEVVRWIDSTLTPTPPYARALVIITDGLPRDTLGYKDSLFAAASEARTRILAVGVGPASDQGTGSLDSAVAVVRELATKTGGVYAGAVGPTQLAPILQALASVSTAQRLLASFRIDPVPAPGTPVEGTVTITGARGTATAHWAFVAP